MQDIERLSRWALIVIGTIAFFAAMDVLETIVAPLALALVTGVVLSPLADFWERRGYSSVIGALIGLSAALLVAACLVLVFQPVFAQLVDQAPKVWSDMQGALEILRGLDPGRVGGDKRCVRCNLSRGGCGTAAGPGGTGGAA